jgi:hypothetical protein
MTAPGCQLVVEMAHFAGCGGDHDSRPDWADDMAFSTNTTKSPTLLHFNNTSRVG